MKILLIGATGFIGTYLVRELAQQGHELGVYHRGNSRCSLPGGVKEVLGDRKELPMHRNEFRRFAPEVVVDLILSSGRQAQMLMDCFRGLASRVVVLSSGDVYRACGILHGFEGGPIQPTPLTEKSEVRTKRDVYGAEQLRHLQSVFPWLDDQYDRIAVEYAVMNDPLLPGTVLRLPMVYGPGDPLHRLFPYLKRMDDGRHAILLQEDAAQWRGPRGYVENIAHAITLATLSNNAAGRIYNVAERESFSETEWILQIGRAANWDGIVVRILKEITPEHLRVRYNTQQHWEMSSARIREELGFAEPVDRQTALQRTIAWERANPPLEIDPAQFDYAAEDAATEAVQKNAAPAPVR